MGRSKTEAGAGRLITVNLPAFGALVRWAGRFPGVKPGDYVFPWCESKQIDLTRATKGWRTAWRTALQRAGAGRVTGERSDHFVYCWARQQEDARALSRIRIEAKRAALDAIAQPIFEAGVHQNVHQIEPGDSSRSAN